MLNKKLANNSLFFLNGTDTIKKNIAEVNLKFNLRQSSQSKIVKPNTEY